MSYTAVNKILEEGTIPEGYEDYTKYLLEMFALSSKMEEKKKIRGAVEFDKPEIKIMTDYKGRVYDIKTLTQRSGEKLIENFMLAANESVSTTISKRMLPCIYRVHDFPAEFRIDKIMETICLNEEGLTKPTSNLSSSKVIQSFLNSIKDKDGYVAYANMMLRGMSKAVYSSSNIGHHGLALKYYSHFTSPIRRYPDLLIHRIIKEYKPPIFAPDEPNMSKNGAWKKYKERYGKCHLQSCRNDEPMRERVIHDRLIVEDHEVAEETQQQALQQHPAQAAPRP